MPHLGDAEAGSLAAQPPPQLLEPASPKVADLTAFGPLGPVPPPVVFDALHAVLSAPSMARAPTVTLDTGCAKVMGSETDSVPSPSPLS